MQKLFLILGVVFFLVGLLFPVLKKFPFGRLPGDIFIETEKFSFAFPVITCIVLSIIATIIFNLYK
tara:strand:- start:3957 stop:4154 length:198 start_codon:yes stop_codon:yes gene_type:complete